MRINLKHTIITGITAFFGFGMQTATAQDPEFTQFYANPLYLNPAMAGSNMCPRVNINYRNQWPNISGSFVTTSASYDQHVHGLNGGIGLLVTSDNAAQTLKTNRVSAMYAYKANLGRKFALNFGAEATYFQKSLDWGKLTFGDQIDPRRGFVYQTNDQQPNTSSSGVDFSAGVMGYTDEFYFGFAAHHLTEPQEGIISGAVLPRKYTAHAGAKIPLESGYSKSKTFISPNILYRQQGTFTQLNIGVYVNNNGLTYGVWYRNKDSFIATLGIETDVLKIGYSYDVTLSKLGIISGGAHEVSLSIMGPCKPPRKRYRTLSCPSF
jgi:type IX secretion system PorP/SprF family membrane protein